MPATPPPLAGGGWGGGGTSGSAGTQGARGAWTNGKTDRREWEERREGEQTQGLGGWKAPERGNLGPAPAGGRASCCSPLGLAPRGRSDQNPLRPVS